jgi:hypothetical protein
MRRDRCIENVGLPEECLQFVRSVGAKHGKGHVVAGQSVAGGDAGCSPGGDVAREAAADVIQDEADAGKAIHLPQHLHRLSGREVVQRKRAEDNVERAVRHWGRTSVADAEGYPWYAGKRAPRLGKDLGRAVGDRQPQRATLAIGPGDHGAWDVAAAGGQIENFGRAITRDVVEQPGQMAEHGRDTAGETIDGADVPKIGRKLGCIMVRKIEKLFGGNAAS